MLRPRHARLTLIGLFAIGAVVGILLFWGAARSSLMWLALAFVPLPILAVWLIPVLARLALIDAESESRMGCLHGVGLVSLPIVILALYLFPDGPLVIVALPALILGAVYGGDVLVAVAFTLGLTNHRSVLDRRPGRRRTRRASVIADPGGVALASVVDGHMAILRATERDHYRPGQAVGRLLLVVTLPMFTLAVAGVAMALGGYDGTPMIVIGVAGTALCLMVGLALVNR